MIMSASDVFVLLPKEIRVSRNARAQWYLRNINQDIALQQHEQHNHQHQEQEHHDEDDAAAPAGSEAEDEATDGEDDGVPSSGAVGLIKAVGVLGQGNTVTEDTRVWFMAQRYAVSSFLRM